MATAEDVQVQPTPTEPGDLFSARYTKGVGVAHRHHTGKPGTVALFANMGNEMLNMQNFCTHNLDFLEEDEVDTTTRWVFTSYLSAATFLHITDTVNGVALANTGVGSSAGHGFLLQETQSTREGEMYLPQSGSPVIAWEWRGLLPEEQVAFWFVGIGETMADPGVTPFMEADGTFNCDNYIGFRHREYGEIELVQCGGGTGNDVVVTKTDTTWTPRAPGEPALPEAYHTLGIRIEYHSLSRYSFYWHCDGKQVGSAKVGDVFNGAEVNGIHTGMCSTLAGYNGNIQDQQITMHIDYIISQISRLKLAGES